MTTNQQIEHLDSLALDYAMTRENTALLDELLTKLKYLLVNHFHEVSDYELQTANLFVEFNCSETDGYYSDFILSDVEVWDQFNNAFQIGFKQLDEIEKAVNNAMDQARQSDWEFEQTLKQL